MASISAASAPQCVLRGELFKSGENNPAFKLRWVECFSDGTLQWSEAEGSPPKGAVSLVEAHVTFEPPLKPPEGKKQNNDADQALYGLRVTPAAGGRVPPYSTPIPAVSKISYGLCTLVPPAPPAHAATHEEQCRPRMHCAAQASSHPRFATHPAIPDPAHPS